jgi:hypothetical protein
MWSEVSDTLLEQFRADPRVATEVEALEADVTAGIVSPAAAARRLLQLALEK